MEAAAGNRQRTTQVAEERIRGTLWGLFGPGRLREQEEEAKEELREEGRRGTCPSIRGDPALTRRYPGTGQSAWRRTPGPQISSPTPTPSKPPSPPTTPQHG